VLLRAVHDRDELAGLLRRDAALHTYELGDLDDFFWPYTTWYRHGDQVALLYHGGGTPTLIALAPPAGIDDLAALVRGLVPLLPTASTPTSPPSPSRRWPTTSRSRPADRTGSWR
jgi:hypothetical protein